MGGVGIVMAVYICVIMVVLFAIVAIGSAKNAKEGIIYDERDENCY